MHQCVYICVLLGMSVFDRACVCMCVFLCMRERVCAVCVWGQQQQQAGEWAAHCLSFLSAFRDTSRGFVSRSIHSHDEDEAQKQDVGQARAAIAWLVQSDFVPALCKPARSSCVHLVTRFIYTLSTGLKRWRPNSSSCLLSFCI